ncbi:MAG: SDR family oxidoreductase [Devosia sp.]
MSHQSDDYLDTFGPIAVVGASRGLGRALALHLSCLGADVHAFARGEHDLQSLQSLDRRISISLLTGDGEESALKAFSIRPRMVFVPAGTVPPMGPIGELEWAEFESTWRVDVRLAFEVTRLALAGGLPPGATVVLFSSGAAKGGSPLSGGYAGAKRTVEFIAQYAQAEAARTGLPLRMEAYVPKGIMPGTGIGEAAIAGYAERQGVSAAKFKAGLDNSVTRAAGDIVETYLPWLPNG